MRKIKCIIIEDEKPAQGVLQNFIDEVPNLELLKTFTNALSAIELLKTNTIDLIFLDINLPQISGLNFLKTLKKPPEVIITTAYSDYALEGYELNVVDYLMKPISFERFLKAVDKVENKAESTAVGKSDNIALSNGYTFEKADNTIYKIEYDKIQYIESERDYVEVITENKKYMFRKSLKYWQSILPEDTFSRVHKSFIVNVSGIDHIFGNRIQIGDQIIPVGRKYKEVFMEKINKMN